MKNHKIKIKAKDWSEDGKSLVDVTYNGKYTGKMKKRSHLEKENLFLRMMIMLNGHILVNSKMAPLMVMVQQLGKKINMLKKKGSIQMVLSHQQR